MHGETSVEGPSRREGPLWPELERDWRAAVCPNAARYALSSRAPFRRL